MPSVLKSFYLAMILSLCITKLVSCDFHNLIECSKYALHISTLSLNLIYNNSLMTLQRLGTFCISEKANDFFLYFRGGEQIMLVNSVITDIAVTEKNYCVHRFSLLKEVYIEVD